MTPQLTTIDKTDGIDTTRDVWAWLHTHGLPVDQLVDPAMIEPEQIENGEFDRLRIVDWDNGPTEFPIDESDLTDDCRYEPASAGVTFGNLNAVQPIGFDNPLNAGERDDPTVFAFGERDYPDLDVDAVLDALDRLVHYTPIRRETVDAWAEALNVDYSLDIWETDAHGEWIRAEWIPRAFVAQIDGLSVQSPDSDIIGHKKTARQRFYRNRDELENIAEVAHV